ncbi:GNAT family N-acetyltransferase [Sphingobacteriaceae bacterium]|nr:GNAT family N-acetyltransferase [Sphingobacteriaceae bacterium]
MLEPNFIPFPVLTTQHLILRRLRIEDSPEIFIHRSDPAINEFIKRDLALNEEDAKNWILKVLTLEEKNESINWAIALKSQTELIGTICLWNIEKDNHVAEVGYSLHPDYFGKGLMTEALLAVNNYGFETMKLSRIDAYTQKGNVRSIKMLEKNGFKRNFDFEKIYPNKEELEYNGIYTLSRK